MFVLDAKEFQIWRSQFVTSKEDRKGLRYVPMAFTEHGVAMLSSVLNSTRAIQVNIAIIRAFIRLRRLLADHLELSKKLNEIEKKYDRQFAVVFDAIRQLMELSKSPRKKIGFHVKEPRADYARKGDKRS